MVRKACLVVLAGLLLASPAAAQTGAWRFRWQAGQVLTYRVEHTTTASETVGVNKTESRTRLNLIKKWQVTAVDPQGVATIQLSLLGLRLETTTPNNQVLLFDSADPTKSDPTMKQQLAPFVGPVLAVLRIDGKGKVVEVKESKHGPASRYENELPFIVTLPEAALSAGGAWERTYQITMEPPQGTGEKYDAVQNYVAKTVTGNDVTVSLKTSMKTQPEAAADQIPLLQLQPEGDVVFDAATGRLKAAVLKIDKEIKNHQGEGSSYRFQSTYTEQLAENPR